MRKRFSPRVVFFTAWIALSLMSIAWAFASPLGSGPDEPAHLIKAASVVRGELVGPQGDTGNIVDVPAAVAWTATQDCYRFDLNQDAGCAPALEGSGSETVTTETSAGYNNPVYYAVVGWPTLLLTGEAGLYGVRIVSAIISSAMLACAFLLVAGWRRRSVPAVGLLIALTPMVIYVNGVVNPSAFEISGSLAVFAAMLSIVLHPSLELLAGRLTILVVTAALAMGARTVSPLWVALAIALPLLLLGWRGVVQLLRQRAVIVSATALAVLAVAAVAWNPISTRLATDARTTSTGGFEVFPDVGSSPLFGFMKMITLSVTNGNDMIGNFGWMDTPVPDTTVVAWTVLLGAIVLAAVYLLRRRYAIFGIALALGFFLVPPLIQAAFITTGGYIWQGRYGLPTLTMMAFGLAAVLACAIPRRVENTGTSVGGTRVVGVIAAAFIYAQSYAFASALHRFTVGSATAWKQMITQPAWSPPGGAVLSLGAFGLGAVLLAVIVVSLHLSKNPFDQDEKEGHREDLTPRAV
ncbi:DUF2142 domain-containing protein [Agreia sp. Leaf210]|uniref:DUF2142 domain-containing protein n=1 Tax=Agreia sp. Leaf210 TaxID=1735682 RepID=UPI00070089F3|nr:DUF2142 domain-containing protein [Agreia sp. Leaf210]KQM60581.1 hypothetical protein ASE64_02575 [Agreia sp. Leaf210]